MKKLLLTIAMTLTINSSAFGAVTAVERDALVALYNSTDGASWTNNDNWGFGDPCDNSWYGVSCTGTLVTWLNLASNQLTGTIPTEIGSLTNLTSLNLGSNQLTGTIPAEIGSLTNLASLRLSGNQFTGAIPTEIGSLANLTSLNLYSNQFTGTIPAEIGNLTNLTVLGLGNNQFFGDIPLNFTNLTMLIQLYLIPNYLTNTDAGIEAWLDTYHSDNGTGGSQTFYSNQTPFTSDIEGLLALYQSTKGTSWTDSTNWGSNDPCINSWFGVTCSGGSVTYLDLYDNNMQGNLPLALAALTPSSALSLGRNYLGNNDDDEDNTLGDWLADHHTGVTDAFFTEQWITAPTSLSFTDKTNTAVTLNWNDDSFNETGFKVFQDGVLIHTTASDVELYSVTGLMANTAYTFEVKATN